jgi:hypothetical protein
MRDERADERLASVLLARAVECIEPPTIELAVARAVGCRPSVAVPRPQRGAVPSASRTFETCRR